MNQEQLQQQVESGEQVGAGNEAYINAISEMKKNYVPKDKLQQVEAENKKLLEALVSGKQIDVPTEKEKPNVNELRKKLFAPDANLSNLEYIQTSLELRNALIDAGERDPFLPTGDRVTLTADHYEKAEQVADFLQSCVDFADGDSGVFTAEYQRRVKDSSILPKARR